MFWFKKKEHVIDCFTTDSYALEYCKITSAVRHYPEWFKRLPGMVDFDNKLIPSIQHCHGFKDLYKNSFMMPYWSSTQIKVNTIENPGYRYESVSKVTMEEHTWEQISGYLPEQKIGHMKILSPWLLKSKDLIKFHWSDPIWNSNRLNDFTILPGILDFKYQHSLNINILFEYREKERLVNLEPGMPLVMLTPLVDDDTTVKMVCHQITEAEAIKYNYNIRVNPFKLNTQGNFESLYLKKKKFLDRHEENIIQDKKCPFGFGKK